ncbi:MAG TPA: ethanolamine ammonia-lyase subunit EutC [Gemmatimonadales bacterium]|nr:ethanolamine ammonia-lyase subunit EutC [Gemmatimonadales bacterium]
MLPDAWRGLRSLTPARIALGRAGMSLPTSEVLAFQLAHARARDAVTHRPDLALVASQLAAAGLPSVPVQSRVSDATEYLTRPDLGRRLRAEDGERLGAVAVPGGVDLGFVIADGLSGLAVERHAAALAIDAGARLRALGWRSAPVVIARFGRVALGDEIGERLGARLVAVLIGERPGLSSPDSLGVYLTWAPRLGRTDAERNCISNIRPEGLPVAAAAERLAWLAAEARRRESSGVDLKEEADGTLLR